MTRSFLDVMPTDMWRHVLHFCTPHMLHTLFLVNRSVIEHAHDLVRSQQVWLECADRLRWNSGLERYQKCLQLPPMPLGPRPRKRPARLIEDDTPCPTRAPRTMVRTPTHMRSRARSPPPLGRSHRIRAPPQRFKPPPLVVRRPSRAARAKRRGRRFGIPSPPPSPVHMSNTSSSSVSDHPTSDLDLDLESAKSSLSLDQLQKHLHALSQAGANDPTFPVPISLAITQVRRLAHLSQSAVHSGQATLVRMASQFDIHSCSMPRPDACVKNDSSDDTSADGDTAHTAPCDAFQFFHEQACAPLHPLLRGFRNIVTGSPILTRLWRKFAHTHAWHTWDAVPATGVAEFIDACQLMRTQLADTQTHDTIMWTPSKNWLQVWERFLTWDHIIGLPGTEHDCLSWDPVVPAECTLGAGARPLGASMATMWLVQEHHTVEDLHRLRSTGSDRWLLAIPSHRSDWKRVLHPLCDQGHAWIAVSGAHARLMNRWTTSHTHTIHGTKKKRKHCYDTVVDWYMLGTNWDLDIHRYIAALSQLTGRGHNRPTWYMPPRSLHTTAGKAVEKATFFDTWHALREERKTLYRTRFASRDLARNLESTLAVLPLSPYGTILSWHRKIFGLSQAWDLAVHQRSCTIYAIVSDFSATVYIGQTGGKKKLRSLVKRFREHIRAGIKFEKKKHRFSTAELSLYEAMHKYGPEHFSLCQSSSPKNKKLMAWKCTG